MRFKNITEYIPQRLPFVLVDRLLFCDEQKTQTEFLVQPDSLFVENNIFTEAGVLENIAQTSAARLGYLDRHNPVRIGMIGSVDKFEMFSFPKVGDEIRTTILLKAEMDNVILIAAEVVCENTLIATCSMKVVLTNTISQS